MKTRISTFAVAATFAALPLLAACGSSTPSAGTQPTPSVSSGASSGPSSVAPVSTATTPAPTTSAPTTSAPTPAATTPSAAPSSDPAEQSGEAKDAAEKFVKTTLTIGYPDKDFKTYLNRLRPLMTSHGQKEVDKSAERSSSAEKGVKTLYKQHARTVPKIGSVKVSSITADKAKVKLDYRMLTQLQTGGKWKTLQTSGKENVTVDLVSKNGKWLVDEAK